MSDFKDIDLSKFSLDLTKTMQYVNPVQDQMARIQREQEQTIRSIQKAREEKEAEELRRHNEIVAALKEAGEKGATIVIGDNANGIQIQQNSDGAMQEMTNSQTFNYDKALEVLKEIKEYIDFPQFQTTFKENSENVKAIIEDTIKAVENKEDVGIVKKSLRILKDLAVGASGSLIASGIIALLGTVDQHIIIWHFRRIKLCRNNAGIFHPRTPGILVITVIEKIITVITRLKMGYFNFPDSANYGIK